MPPSLPWLICVGDGEMGDILVGVEAGRSIYGLPLVRGEHLLRALRDHHHVSR